jgi:hypothetical protein
LNKELSPRVFWGIAAAVVIVGGGIAFGLIRASDPAAQGPLPYKPFDPSKHNMTMPSPFAGGTASATQSDAGH